MTDETRLPTGDRRDPAQAATRRRLEELVALRTAELAVAKDAAEAALAAKSAFLARMSHEIRTPMNTIIGLNHIMLRDVTDPQMKQQIGKVLGAAEHLLGLIDDILDLSRIEAGQAQLAEGDFSARQLIDGVGGLIASQLSAKGLELRVEVADDVPRVLRGDANRIRQVLVNFATNAVKFTERGTVWFSATLADRDAGKVRIRFAVTDTGVGLSEDQCQRVFQAFEQGDGGATRRFGGTGLGLALCARLAQLMRGRVAVTSVPGEGSTFSLEVPLAVGEAAAARVDPPADEPTGLFRALGGPDSRRLLLVDDNELNLEVAATFLRILGYQAEIARDGIEAIEKAQQDRFAAILVDVQMPRMDGLEATRHIRQLPRHATTPIIAMTASVFEEDRKQCLAAGMDDLVSKPVDPTLLGRVLSRWAPIASPVQAVPAQATVAVPAAPQGTALSAESRARLLELQRLVAEDDMSAREFFQSLPADDIARCGGELGRALDEFNYERAGTLLARLLEERDIATAGR